MGFRGEEERRPRKEREGAARPGSRGAEGGRGRRGRPPWLLVSVALLLLVLLVAAAVLLWRSFGDTLSGTSVARDSIDSGPEPRIRLTNGPGQVSVEGVEDLESVEYEVTKHAVASDPSTAKERAAGVPVDFSREDSTFVLQTDGGRGTGADYALRVPTGSSLEIESAAGDVEVSNISGEVRIFAGAGDVTVRDAGGSVGIESPGGDVNITEMGTDTGQAELEVGTGDVELQNLVVGTLEAAVEAGTVTFSGRFSGGGRVFVRTGDVVVRLPAEDTRELTLEAQIGEVVREEGEPSGEPSGAPGDREENSGAGEP